ncbi:MAG: hypothetical protein G01um101418_464 [Parcubacteria group bacterium Gr01-1014_18]|nr:MAG: hypothetical protein Greene041636_510 [Parcubacteria group bacterium Greene0416_36]TSC81051.1 MAG: hypothetical protein G01um101418_464 [Parcubacteria group bacterium Gr01-1014_18]TSC98785.1 MAG: hypothetical protein Greene101420_535 [Parcubacteria group bacterium Greene1014_20]TSD06735.1 MAG: hypothetical protein Greene07142_656 [Parcubacteria group bacterium Greene0714_2]
MKVAIISYNEFVDCEGNGWKVAGKNSVLLLQNTGSAYLKSITMEERQKEIKEVTNPLWIQLQNERANIDKIVLYVGSNGSEELIEQLAKQGLTYDQAIFVFCDCDITQKIQLIKKNQLESSQFVLSECGGRETMLKIYKDILRKGALPNPKKKSLTKSKKI